MIDGYHINRLFGDYVIYSKEENVEPFFVRVAGHDVPISTHSSVTEAVKQIEFYQEAQNRCR